MPYDSELAARVRIAISRRRGSTEKTMFGGVGFLLNGNMCVGVWREFLILRLGVAAAEAALREPFVKPFDITGRAMKGWAMVALDGLEDDDELKDWIAQAVKFVKTLLPK